MTYGEMAHLVGVEESTVTRWRDLEVMPSSKNLHTAIETLGGSLMAALLESEEEDIKAIFTVLKQDRELKEALAKALVDPKMRKRIKSDLIFYSEIKAPQE